MADPKAFALTRSTLNPFLFAGVGHQTNGAELTILSLLARLGSDPWEEAARLAALPRTSAADWLADRITTMPLTAEAIGEAGATAARLVLLLPLPFKLRASATPGTGTAGPQASRWAIVALIAGALAIHCAASVLQAPASQPPDVASDHIVQHDQ